MRRWTAAHSAGLGVAALALTVVAMVLPIQHLETGCAQMSTFSLVRSLDRGTPRIDPYESETCDKSFAHGHFYSNKAPGLAFAILPVYSLLHAAGALPDNPRTTLWILGLWSSVLPAAIMLLVARRIARRFDPGTATLTAVALGLSTLTLPLATVDFGHLLAATLLLAAFAIALEERRPGGRLLLLVAAGALAGFAVTTEYPAALVAVVVGLYAAAAGPVKRLLAFGAGGLVGLIPLLAYNRWAFGSITSLSYSDAVNFVRSSGSISIGHHDRGFFGVLVPSLSAFTRILLADRGLLTVTPILILGVVGVVLLFRRGFRAEAIAIAAAAAAMLVYNSSLTISAGWVFGGDTPGPRYCYLAVPFLLLPLGLVFRSAPAVVWALFAVGVVRMTTATATQPMVGNEGTLEWLRHIRDGEFTHTVLTLLGLGTGWIAITPFVVLVLAAALAAIAAAPRDVAAFSWTQFFVTVGAWGFVALAGSTLVLANNYAATAIGLAAVAAGCLLVLTTIPGFAVTKESDTRAAAPAG